MSLPKLFLFAITFWTSPLFAGHSSVEREYFPIAWCEQALTKNQVASVSASFINSFFGRAYFIDSVHKMTALGFQKLGLRPHLDEFAIRNLLLTLEPDTELGSVNVAVRSYNQGEFIKILGKTFSRSQIAAWNAVELKGDLKDKALDDDLRHTDLRTKPFTLEDSRVGYVTEPDADGVRRFIRFSEDDDDLRDMGYIVFGIDVPWDLDKVKKYTNDYVEVVDDLVTSGGKYRRISVLTFVRVVR